MSKFMCDSKSSSMPLYRTKSMAGASRSRSPVRSVSPRRAGVGSKSTSSRSTKKWYSQFDAGVGVKEYKTDNLVAFVEALDKPTRDAIMAQVADLDGKMVIDYLADKHYKGNHNAALSAFNAMSKEEQDKLINKMHSGSTSYKNTKAELLYQFLVEQSMSRVIRAEESKKAKPSKEEKLLTKENVNDMWEAAGHDPIKFRSMILAYPAARYRLNAINQARVHIKEIGPVALDSELPLAVRIAMVYEAIEGSGQVDEGFTRSLEQKGYTADKLLSLSAVERRAVAETLGVTGKTDLEIKNKIRSKLGQSHVTKESVKANKEKAAQKVQQWTVAAASNPQAVLDEIRYMGEAAVAVLDAVVSGPVKELVKALGLPVTKADANGKKKPMAKKDMILALTDLESGKATSSRITQSIERDMNACLNATPEALKATIESLKIRIPHNASHEDICAEIHRVMAERISVVMMKQFGPQGDLVALKNKTPKEIESALKKALPVKVLQLNEYTLSEFVRSWLSYHYEARALKFGIQMRDKVLDFIEKGTIPSDHKDIGAFAIIFSDVYPEIYAASDVQRRQLLETMYTEFVAKFQGDDRAALDAAMRYTDRYSFQYNYTGKPIVSKPAIAKSKSPVKTVAPRSKSPVSRTAVRDDLVNNALRAARSRSPPRSPQPALIRPRSPQQPTISARSRSVSPRSPQPTTSDLLAFDAL